MGLFVACTFLFASQLKSSKMIGFKLKHLVGINNKFFMNKFCPKF